MPSYAYTVLNKKGEKLLGTIDSSDMGNARENLNKLGFSVVAIEEAEKISTATAAGTQSYEFEAIDETGKKVEGTIKARERISAYKRLKEEYHLEVRFLVDTQMNSSEKMREKTKGTTELEVELRKELKEITKDREPQLQQKASQEEEVKAKVESIIKKVDQFIQSYRDVLDPQKLEGINQAKDKILRIKSSKNLEYIKDSASALLKLLQEEELFVKGKISDEKKTHLQVEAKKVMEDLNVKGVKKITKNDIVEKLQKWDQEHLGDREDLKWYEKITEIGIAWLTNIFKEDPQVTDLKQRISIVNHQIFEYVKLYLKEKSISGKEDIKNSMKSIISKRKNLKAELSGLKSKLRDDNMRSERETKIRDDLSFGDLAESFTGWLLAFYLGYYFAAMYITTKDFGLTSIPKGFYIEDSIAFKYIIVIIFITHTSLSIKHKFFKNSPVAGIMIYPISTLTGILILFNL